MFLARTSLASRVIWYAAGAVRYGAQQVKLRGNHRGVALPGWSLPCVAPLAITSLKSRSTEKPYRISNAAYWPCNLRRSRSSPEAIAEEKRSQDVACHAFQLNGITTMQPQSIPNSYPSTLTFPRPRAFASPVLGKWNYRDEAKPRLNRQGTALREMKRTLRTDACDLGATPPR